MNTTRDNHQQCWQPIKIASYDDKESLRKFISKETCAQVVDSYHESLSEIVLLRNPHLRFNTITPEKLNELVEALKKDISKLEGGVWFYFPWSNKVVSYLGEALHQELRTGRNRHLITSAEQERFYNATIGIAGLSIGSHVALTITMTGGAKHIKLADPDVISGDNLNRIRSGFENVGVPKVVTTARLIYEINPYAKVEIYQDGITEDNLSDFLLGKNKLDLLIEEMDHPYFKIKIRYEARSHGIPVLMTTDNGDGAIVDIERYDADKKYPILHGLVDDNMLDELKSMKPEDLPRVAAKLAGANLATIRMLESVREVGKSIYSWPQLGTAATLGGALIGYLARKVILKDSHIVSGRYNVNPEAIFEEPQMQPQTKKQQEKKRKEILKLFGI